MPLGTIALRAWRVVSIWKGGARDLILGTPPPIRPALSLDFADALEQLHEALVSEQDTPTLDPVHAAALAVVENWRLYAERRIGPDGRCIVEPSREGALSLAVRRLREALLSGTNLRPR